MAVPCARDSDDRAARRLEKTTSPETRDISRCSGRTSSSTWRGSARAIS